MRFINTKKPDVLPHSLLNAKTEQEQIALHKDKDRISEKIYKGDKIIINNPEDPYHAEEEFEVRYQLRTLFYNKCAYCECIEYKPDVEHYRPKKRVTGNQGNTHGYYWLCYEWTNLLPACSACNSRSGKWNKFPVGGKRVVVPPLTASGNLDFDECKADSPYLQQEDPFLINPELEEPAQFLKLEWNGKLSALNDDRKAKKSIDVYDLNRGNLIEARKEIIDNFLSKINLLFNGFRDDKISANILQYILVNYLKLFVSKSHVSYPYSFVRLYMVQHFSGFVEDNFEHFSDLEKQLLKESFPSGNQLEQ